MQTIGALATPAADGRELEPRPRHRRREDREYGVNWSRHQVSGAVLGFDLCGIAPATALPELDAAARVARSRLCGRDGVPAQVGGRPRRHPQFSADRAVRHRHRHDILHRRLDSRHRIARYAWGEDYHLVLAERLERSSPGCASSTRRPFDAASSSTSITSRSASSPEHAGLGWIGKNTCLINPDIGSWIFLAGVATSLDLPADAPLP